MTMTPIKLKVTREDTVQNSSAGSSVVFSFGGGVGDFLTPPHTFSRNSSFTAGSGKCQKIPNSRQLFKEKTQIVYDGFIENRNFCV